jgi:hypothetical protein
MVLVKTNALEGMAKPRILQPVGHILRKRGLHRSIPQFFQVWSYKGKIEQQVEIGYAVPGESDALLFVNNNGLY